MKDLKIYIAIASLLLIVYVVAQYNKPKPVNWSETFDKEDKIPFGTHILYSRLHDIFSSVEIKPERRPPYLPLTEDSLKTGTYLIVAPSLKIDTYDYKKLAEFMDNGNDVFIASYYLGSFMEDSLKTKVNTEFHDGAKATSVSFLNPALNPQKKYTFDKGISEQFFVEFDSSKAVILGKNSYGNPNFIKYPVGKGNLYLIASPYFFTNYNLLNPAGAEYAAKALSYLPAGKKIIWDEFSSLGNAGETTPMRVFFKYKELKWAYYMSLYSLLLFVLFHIKRKQRVIPVIEPLKNSTLEFTKVVGQVYYQQRNHTNIANKKIMYWLENLRGRYNLKTTTFDKEFIETLSNKSGVSQNLIEDLIQQMSLLKNTGKFADSDLINLNRNLEEFYLQSK